MITVNTKLGKFIISKNTTLEEVLKMEKIDFNLI